MEGYNISICDRCGSGYASDVPPQSVFDRYYGEMSKYERSQDAGRLSVIDKDRYRQIADLVAPRLRTDDTIIDVGCATGALLAEFKCRGFGNVLGVDPSMACAATGQRLYGIPIRCMTGSRLSEIPERFDLAMLTGVLEHLCDVDASLKLILGLLKPGGQIYIEVPDATHYTEWFSAPYQFFSMEHVNYFSPLSLANLMLRLGLKAEFVERVPRWLGPNAAEPAIAGLFRRDPHAHKNILDFDWETEAALKAYICTSARLEERIHLLIDEIVRSQVPLVVWGTGTHTLRLLETSSLPKANLVAFLDSNLRYQGKRLNGIPILNPSDWRDPAATILISSHVAEKEIKDQILTSLKWPNRVVSLYEGISAYASAFKENIP